MKNFRAHLAVIQKYWRSHWTESLVLLAWFALGTWFFLHAMQWRADGWYFGHGNVWSDWSLHVSQATRFVVTPQSEWWRTSSYYAGGAHTYPFASNLLSAGLIRFGFSYPFAFIGPSILFWGVTLLVLWRFGTWILRSGKQSVLALSIFFCSAGLGLFRVLDTHSWWQEFINPTRDYTQFTEYQWGTGNLFLGMFLPQRAFLMGFWWALAGWFVWLQALEKPWSKRVFCHVFFAGIWVSMLPIIHMHSFLAIIFLSAPIALRFWKEKWRHSLVFASMAALGSIPLYLKFVSGGIENPHFFQINLFWTTDSLIEWLLQWSWQWGVALPLALYGLWHIHGRISSIRWWSLASFFGVFLLANIVQFQPTAWDNTKLFLWVYVGVSLLAAWVISMWWRQSVVGKIAAVSMLVLLVGTGGRELLRSAEISRYTYQATSVQSYELALRVRDQVAPSAVFATAPVHNHWVTMWAGRPIVMGYSAWVWNFGFLYQDRERELRDFYVSSENEQNFIHKYTVEYIVVGPDEKSAYGPWLRDFSHFSVVDQTDGTTVYAVD